MWFDIIKDDRPTVEDIERIRAIQYQSEEDKKKIKEYEQSEGEKEEREKLIERLEAVRPDMNESHVRDISSRYIIEDFRELIKINEEQYKINAATKKSLGLLNKVIESNDKVTIIKEPEFEYGSIHGTVEIEGESGHTYYYDFRNDPQIEKNINFDREEIRDIIAEWQYSYPEIEITRRIPICLSCEGDLPAGDNIATMILGLLNDEKSSEDIEALDFAITDHNIIDWEALHNHINDFMSNINLKPFIISRFEE
tara:strand:- start:3187 stop:3948 length:762 start_codon:yes stop_codon:yes gene_type:complete